MMFSVHLMIVFMSLRLSMVWLTHVQDWNSSLLINRLNHCISKPGDDNSLNMGLDQELRYKHNGTLKKPVYTKGKHIVNDS